MKCGKPANLGLILIGLHQIGVIGLYDALKKAEVSGLTDREEIVDLLVELLERENYTPDSQKEAYRLALWREFLRLRGEDISEFYSDVEVRVRGENGKERDSFVEMMVSVFGDFELKPNVTYVQAVEEDPTPELLIGDETVVRGCQDRKNFKRAVGKRISEW